MAAIEVQLLFTLEMQAESVAQIGAIAQGYRAIGDVSGRFEGPELKGTIRATDWFVYRSDGVLEADVRGTMKTADGALIYMHYTGLVDTRKLPDVGGPLPARGTCPVRTAVRFETGAERYRELNNVQAIGVGEVTFETGQIKYDIYAL